MRVIGTFWTKATKAIIALALAFLVLTPTFDSVVCASEPTTATAVHEASVETGDIDIEKVHHDGGSLLDADGLCSHGHCHHAAQFLENMTNPVSEPSLRLRDAAFATKVVFPDDHRFGLKRPPRA
jgi:hypothetical protein